MSDVSLKSGKLDRMFTTAVVTPDRDRGSAAVTVAQRLGVDGRAEPGAQAAAREGTATFLERLAITHVMFPVALMLVATIGFALSIPLSPWVLAWALLATAAA